MMKSTSWSKWVATNLNFGIFSRILGLESWKNSFCVFVVRQVGFFEVFFDSLARAVLAILHVHVSSRYGELELVCRP